jgi:hypothetical protein
VITASTLITPKFGLLSCSLPGKGGCGAQEPAQSETTARKASNFRTVDNWKPRKFPSDERVLPHPDRLRAAEIVFGPLLVIIGASNLPEQFARCEVFEFASGRRRAAPSTSVNGMHCGRNGRDPASRFSPTFPDSRRLWG